MSRRYMSTEDHRYVFGFDGPLQYFFIDVEDLDRGDDDPLWSSTFSVKKGVDPFRDHKTPEAVIQAMQEAGYNLPPDMLEKMTKFMLADQAGWVDQRTPGMKAFQEKLGSLLEIGAKRWTVESLLPFGTQMIYVPNHIAPTWDGTTFAYPGGAQPGFIISPTRDNKGYFCRYWLIENGHPVQELRTKANSEATYLANIVVRQTVPDEWITKAVKEIEDDYNNRSRKEPDPR